MHSEKKQVSSGETNTNIFKYISLHVRNISESIEFYRDALDAKIVLYKDPDHIIPTPSALLSFSHNSPDHQPQHQHYPTNTEECLVELVELGGNVSLDRGEASGRFAIETEDDASVRICDAISRLKYLSFFMITLYSIV